MCERTYETMKCMEEFRFSEGYRGNAFIGQVKDMPIHIHNGIELLYVLKGAIEIKISFNRYELDAGDFLLINPHEVHSLKAEITAEILFLQMDLGLFEGKEFAFDLHFYKTYNQEVVKKVKSIMKEAYLSFANREQLLETERLFQKTASLCDAFFQVNQYDAINREQASCADHSTNRQRMQEIYEYLYESYWKKPTLTYVAGMEHLDMFYASRLIKDSMGTNFQNTLNIIRADRSELFLLGTDLPIQQVGEKAGFSSHAYFVKQFKTYFGMAPSAYRKQYRDQVYPKKKMNYKMISYDRAVLDSKIRQIETDRQQQTQEQHLEEIQALLEHAAFLCSYITGQDRKYGNLMFQRTEGQVELQLPEQGIKVKITQKK